MVLMLSTKEHVKKVKDFGAVDDFLVEICQYAMNNGEVGRC